MATGIRFPSQLRVPDRTGYTESFEDTRSLVEMEVGPARRRNRHRRPPQLFDLQWTFSQEDFQVFDVWWQDTIKGGEREFDIRLLDAHGTVVWYTVTAKGEYKAEIVNEMEWRVTLQVKALADNFGETRAAGTDELRAVTSFGVTARGNLLIPKTLRGATSVGMTAAARLSLPGLRSFIDVGLFRLPRARFALPFIGSEAVGISASSKFDEGLRSTATVGVTSTGALQVGT